jgi:hypothetical protein
MIPGKVAECPAPTLVRGRRERRELARATVRPTVCEGVCTGGGASADGTLTYEYSVAPTGARTFAVQMRQNGAMREVLRSQVAAE